MLNSTRFIKISAISYLGLLIGCVSNPNYRIARTYTAIDIPAKTFPKSNSVELYFVGEQPKFEYEKMGVVQVSMTSNVDKTHLFSHLKYEAWQKGADAIIAVTEDDKSYTYTTYSSSSKSSRVHSVFVPFVQGIAVKKKPLSDPYNYSDLLPVDTSFTDIVRSDEVLQAKSKGGANAVVIINLVAIGVLLVSLTLFTIIRINGFSKH